MTVTDAQVPTGARLTIDLEALAANWRAIAAGVTAPAETAAVVKADGYGLGVAEVGLALHQAGCRTFFVAAPGEGLTLRSALPDATIYVLAGLLPGTAPFLNEHGLRPVLGSMREIEEWVARRTGPDARCAIHVDTGMNRLGLSVAEGIALAERRDLLETIAPALVMSHLVISEDAANPLNEVQRERFARVSAAFAGIPASLANTAGVFLGPEYHFDMVRPGIGNYGATPGPGVPVPMHVVVTAEAQVILVREGAPGETVGYGGLAQLTRPTRIAILSAGYADGYHRRTDSASMPPRVFIRGQSAPLLGRVSMDLIAVDVTAIPEAARGDWAELFGPNIPVDEVAGYSGTVGYELLTGLGKRYARRYRGLPEGS